MEQNIIRKPICPLLTALAILILSSCGNGGGGASTQAGGGSDTATLSWTAPTTNADGTSLNDLAGYKIYYGTSSGTYTEMVDITDPQQTNHAIENLTPGNYFFAATAYDTEGNESDFSNEVSKTIQ